MSERLVQHLAAWLAESTVIVASVLGTRGATPRKRGSHMLIRERNGAVETFGSIGGGEAEARVIAESLGMMADGLEYRDLRIDLDGSPDAAGICGGRMQLVLSRWDGVNDQHKAEQLAQRLASGHPIELDVHSDAGIPIKLHVQPFERLLIVGGGHCGLALHELARFLDFELCVFDERDEYAHPDRFPGALCLSGGFESLQQALATRRPVYAVLLSRDFHTDLAALEQLASRPPDFIGMMGSARRIHQVREALAGRLPRGQALDFARIRAPIGLDIGAHTPHEIAVSVLAELISFRQAASAAT